MNIEKEIDIMISPGVVVGSMTEEVFIQRLKDFGYTEQDIKDTFAHLERIRIMGANIDYSNYLIPMVAAHSD